MAETIRHLGPLWFPRLFDVLGGLEDPRWDWANNRIADLEAENARLQARGDGYKSESETSFARARRAEANLDTEQSYTADLEATLACDHCSSPLDHAKHLSLDVEEAVRERDGYKALAERRGEALELVASPPNDEEVGYNAANLRGLLALFRNEARATLAATPKEKE